VFGKFGKYPINDQTSEGDADIRHRLNVLGDDVAGGHDLYSM
jgi:hypothetical protein